MRSGLWISNSSPSTLVFGLVHGLLGRLSPNHVLNTVPSPVYSFRGQQEYFILGTQASHPTPLQNLLPVRQPCEVGCTNLLQVFKTVTLQSHLACWITVLLCLNVVTLCSLKSVLRHAEQRWQFLVLMGLSLSTGVEAGMQPTLKTITVSKCSDYNPKNSREYMVGRHVALHLHYKVLNSKFTMTRK